MTASRSRAIAMLALAIVATQARAQPVLLLTDPTPPPGGAFGRDVTALGGNVAVGEPGLNAGEVLLIDPASGALVQSFLPPPGTARAFGHALGAFGGNLLIGDFGADSVATRAGAVYLYDGATGALLQTFLPPPVSFQDFGSSVAALGSNVLGGSGSHPSSHLFDGGTAALLRTFPVGGRVAPFGANVLIGHHNGVTLFDAATGATLLSLPSPPSAPHPRAVAFGSDILVASPNDDTAGPDAGAVYRVDGTTGALLQTYLPPVPGTQFGSEILPSGTGFYVSQPGAQIGEPVVGAVFLIDAASGAVLRTFVNPTGVLSSEFGHSFGHALAEVAGRLVVGAQSAPVVTGMSFTGGAAYVFRGGPVACGPCETLDGPGACVVAPTPSCRSVAPGGKMRLVLRDAPGESRDLVTWRGLAAFAGVAFDPPGAVFGDPRHVGTAHDYALCVYDESAPTPSLLFRAIAPAGGTCGASPCWKALLRDGDTLWGYRYRDADRTPEGVNDAFVRVPPSGPMIVVFKAQGPNLTNRPLGLPSLPLPVPLRVQLQVREGSCWEAVYSTPTANTATRFVARSD